MTTLAYRRSQGTAFTDEGGCMVIETSELLWKRELVRTKGSWRDGIEWQLQCPSCAQSYCTKVNRSVIWLLIVEWFYSEEHYCIRVQAHWELNEVTATVYQSLPTCDFLEDCMCRHLGHVKCSNMPSRTPIFDLHVCVTTTYFSDCALDEELPPTKLPLNYAKSRCRNGWKG